MDSLGLMMNMINSSSGSVNAEIVCGCATSNTAIAVSTGPTWSINTKNPITALLLWFNLEYELNIALNPHILAGGVDYAFVPDGIEDKCNLYINYTANTSTINMRIRKASGSTSGVTSVVTYFGYALY